MTHKSTAALRWLLGSGHDVWVADFSTGQEIAELCRQYGVRRVSWSSWAEFEETMPPADIMISYKLPKIIPMSAVQRCRCGGFNIHPSLLPKYPGLNPWFEMQRAKETIGGVTIHRLTEKPDAGDVVLQQAFAIDPDAPIAEAMAQADEIAVGLLRRLLENLASA